MDIRTKELLLAFFEAENKRDWITYRNFLSPYVIWKLHSRHIKITQGKDNYLTAKMSAYEDSIMPSSAKLTSKWKRRLHCDYPIKIL